MNNSDSQNWNTIITANKKIFDINLKSVWEYRYLVKMFIKRDFIVTYKQTILGPVWYLVQPIITSVIQMFIFGKMAKLGTDGIPYILFYFAGTMLWTFFSSCLLSCSKTFTINKEIFSKVYFPRITVPIASCSFHIIRLLLQFLLLEVLLFYYIFTGYNVHFSPYIFLFPLIILWIGILGGGTGLIISSLTTKYRDLNIILEFGLQLFMYATPIVYPLSQIPDKYSWLAYLNPLCAPVELSRIFLFNAGNIRISMIIASIGFAFIAFFIGIILFNRNERNFVDVI